MTAYAILLNPGHNRVYFETAKQLATAEFAFVAPCLSVSCSESRVRDIVGISYLVFQTEKMLSADDIRTISHLSFSYALYLIIAETPQVSFQPVPLDFDAFVSQKISSLLKYTGKTNELFTRMMIGVASSVSGFTNETHLRLLDPLAGKGTTLYEGLAWGYDVWGIELNKKYTEESCVFIKKFLESERLKHTMSTETLHAENHKAFKTAFSVAKSKNDQKEGLAREFVMISGDTRFTLSFIKKRRFHIIVSDLPYGIQHGSAGGKSQASVSRNPQLLLKDCLAGWYSALMPGGVMVLAWNTFVLSRQEMSKMIAASGFDVFPPSPESAFLHRVDQAINRDIIIAKKPN